MDWRARGLALFFAALTLLQLVPVWSVHYLPTVDGASHVYNAWILRALALGRASDVIAAHYQIDWNLNPNWISHAFLAVALSFVSPAVAEKLLFSLILLVFLGGAWLFARADDPGNGVYAFLAFPLAFHWLLMCGFYNFALSVGLYMIVLAFWWKRRDDPSPSTIAAVALLLLLCYFGHPMSAALAIGSIGILWLTLLRRRPLRSHALHLLAFVPTLGLLQWFLSSHSGEEITGGAAVRSGALFSQLAQTQLIVTFDERQLILGRLLFVVVVVLIVVTLFREWNAAGRHLREADAFLLVAIVFLAIDLWAPSETPGRAWINQRMSLFVILAPLPWLTARLPGRMKGALVSLFAIIAVANAGFQLVHFQRSSKVVERFLVPLQTVKPGSIILPMNFNRITPPDLLGVTDHAVDRVALEKGLVDLDNYEPHTGYFPIRFRSGIRPVHVLEDRPGLTNLVDEPNLGYVVTWMMPANEPIAARLERDFDLRFSGNGARLYERR
jgi:hypothetical protein